MSIFFHNKAYLRGLFLSAVLLFLNYYTVRGCTRILYLSLSRNLKFLCVYKENGVCVSVRMCLCLNGNIHLAVSLTGYVYGILKRRTVEGGSKRSGLSKIFNAERSAAASGCCLLLLVTVVVMYIIIQEIGFCHVFFSHTLFPFVSLNSSNNNNN